VSLIFIIGVLVAIVFVVKLVKQSAQAAKDAWLWAAQELGLRFEPGGMFAGSTISGIVEGNMVVVDTYSQSTGNSSQTYTRYEIRYARSLHLGMKLTRQSAMSGVAKIFGAEDVEVGDRVFDDQVMVKVRDKQQFQQYLTRERRKAITHGLSQWPSLKIEDDALRTSTAGMEKDPAKLVRTVKQLLALAETVSGDRPRAAPRPAPPPVPSAVAPPPIVLTPSTPAPPPVPGAVAPPPIALTPSTPPPEEVVVAPEPSDLDLDLALVCADLYRKGQGGSDAEQLFVEKYEGEEVRGVGVLRSTQRYSFDVVFGDTPAIRAMVDVYDDDSGGFGSRTVQAAVKFPEDMRDVLTERSGQEVTFAGRLVKFDRLLRKLYVAEGRWVEAP
jgi:hypothetical protein